jgi:hypothetical protein
VCAVLGLRAMFFLLQNVLDKFAYLKYGLGLVLAYIGAKMLVAEGLPGLDPIHIPVGISLGIVAALISGSVIISLVLPPPVDHQQVLEQTEAASLIADIDPHASLSAAVQDSQIREIPPGAAAEESDLHPIPPLEPPEKPRKDPVGD